MPELEFLQIFQGIATMAAAEPKIAIARVVLIALGLAFVYLGVKGTLEPLIMIPMGFGMASVNAGVLYLSGTKAGTLFIDPTASDPSQLLDALQINFLQPIYTFSFSNGLIAVLIFFGIGVLTDIGYMLISPIRCMIIAIFAYLYLSLAYAGYPYLVRLMIPKKLRGIKMEQKDIPNISKGEKITFAVITSTLLSFLFPVASPLFMGFFLGIVIRESGVKPFIEFIGGPLLYGATFFLGLLLGVLFEASTILEPKVLLLLILGLTALLLSGIGGIIGGYVVYWTSGRTFNPVIGIAGVSCLPTTAKVAQKEAHAANKFAIILPWAMGASVSGVITSAIIAGIYVSLLR